jgi:hypothetical protein
LQFDSSSPYPTFCPYGYTTELGWDAVTGLGMIVVFLRIIVMWGANLSLLFYWSNDININILQCEGKADIGEIFWKLYCNLQYLYYKTWL